MGKLSITLFILITFTSCKLVKVLSVTLSEEKRVYENKKEINKKLKKYSINTNQSFYLSKTGIDSLSKMPYVINMYKYEKDSTLDLASPLQIRIYDSLGNIYMNWEQCFGELDEWGILKSYPPKVTEYAVKNKKINIENDINLIEASDFVRKSIIKTSQNKQYTFFVLYVNWLGLYTNEVLKKMSKYEKKYKDKIQVIYINTSTYYK